MNMINDKLIDKSKAYRPIPFWSWNDKLCEQELINQINHMSEISMGGFFMHARGGLQTEYLSDDWMNLTKSCINQAKLKGMDAWCYDENGWPSGFAGMKLLEDSNNWAHFLTHETKAEFDAKALAVYTIEDNNLKRLDKHSESVKKYICIYDNTNSSVVDILNNQIVKKFINLTHEKYFEKMGNDFGNGMAGFFTDEPQYYRWDTAYTPVIHQAYFSEYNQDILDLLGALFVDCNQAYEFRYRYWMLINQLYTESFAKQIYTWCDEHNCKLTGHSIEERGLHYQMWCCAGIMPFYEYQHIPGVDWLGREIDSEITPKQVSSVARQLGKKQVITETFACTGWDVTPKELKLIAEWQYVNGVNMMCHHLYPYSIHGQRKRDYPTFFSKHNTWAESLKEFNEYFTLLGTLLGESNEIVDACVIHPMHSAYLTYNRQTDYESVKDINDSFVELVEKLGASHIFHHYADETLLKKYGSVNKDKLVIGNCSYKYVIIPKMNCLDKSTVDILKEYINQGGNVYIYSDTPEYIAGKRDDTSFLRSNITFDQMKSQEACIDNTLTSIRSTLVEGNYGKFLFTVNLSNSDSYNVTFKIKAKGAILLDLENKEKKEINFKCDGEYIHLPLNFEPTQSYIIILDDNCKPAANSQIGDTKSSELNFTLEKTDLNNFTIDCVQISFDGITYSKHLPVPCITDMLLNRRKNTKVFLKYTFDAEELPETIYLEAEKMNNKTVSVNDKAIHFDRPAQMDPSFICSDISKVIQVGTNEIVFEIDYFQSEHVYNVLFDVENVTESLINCLSYDTNIEAIYLKGDFGVKSKLGFAGGDIKLSDGGFYICSKSKCNKSINLLEDGYTFFAGKLHYKSQFNIQDTKSQYSIKLNGRFMTAEIYVNGNHAKKLMFTDICDISKHLVKGSNTIEIVLTNSNRNMLGPFHWAECAEPKDVSPMHFDMQGTWQDEKSEYYRDSYSFTEFGLKNITLITQTN